MWLWIRSKTAERALLYVAAVLTSIFLATHLSPWFAHRFMDDGNAFMWLMDQMKADTRAVGLMGRVVPAVPADAGVMESTRWIAIHVLQAMLTVLIAWAIFWLFIAVEFMMNAFWDDEGTTVVKGDVVWANISGLVAGVAAGLTTIWFVASLSWVQSLQVVHIATQQSVLFATVNSLLANLPGLHAMVSWA